VEREAGDPEGNLVIVEKCACREAIRLPEAEGRAPKGPQGAAVERKRQHHFSCREYGWVGSAHSTEQHCIPNNPAFPAFFASTQQRN
jgi:hypothetical protein